MDRVVWATRGGVKTRVMLGVVNCYKDCSVDAAAAHYGKWLVSYCLEVIFLHRGRQ
jgi:hypothetical protein